MTDETGRAGPADDEFDQLLERSSLGTPNARALQAMSGQPDDAATGISVSEGESTKDVDSAGVTK